MFLYIEKYIKNLLKKKKKKEFAELIAHGKISIDTPWSHLPDELFLGFRKGLSYYFSKVKAKTIR